MNEQSVTSAAMHIDHQHCKQEHATWRSDIVLWQEEYDAMRTALAQLERAIQRHGEALRCHAAAINDHEATLDLHERYATEREVGLERKGMHVDDSDVRQRQAIAHLDQRRVHDRMKREHYKLVGQLEMLDTILSE